MAAVMAFGSAAASFGAQAYSPLAAGIEPVKITAQTFPDANFRAYVSSAFDTDKNGTLDPDELLVARNIHCDRMGIKTLKGIEHLVELRGVYASFNELTELDLSKNTKLTHLDAFNNPGNGYDYPLNNKLTKLDLSHNPKMKRLDIWANYDLKFVDISVCPGLQYYNCAMIGATKVDVSKNPELNRLNCSYNKNLTSLDLSHNPKRARR